MKLFIWDFHGTLEKGNEQAVVEITNAILHRGGYAVRLDEKRAEQWYGKKWHEYFEHLLPEESHAVHVRLQDECIAHQRLHPEIVARYIKATNYAHEVLTAIAESHDQIIISGAKSVDVGSFIRAAGFDSFFPSGKFFGLDDHATKEQVARAYHARHWFDHVVIVGDSPNDIIPFENATSYLYAHPSRSFRECVSTYKIRDLREILREV